MPLIFLKFVFKQLPEVGPSISNLNDILESNIINLIESGQETLQNIKSEIDDAVSDQLGEVKSSLKTAGINVFKMFTYIKNKSRDVGTTDDLIFCNLGKPKKFICL